MDSLEKEGLLALIQTYGNTKGEATRMWQMWASATSASEARRLEEMADKRSKLAAKYFSEIFEQINAL